MAEARVNTDKRSCLDAPVKHKEFPTLLPDTEFISRTCTRTFPQGIVTPSGRAVRRWVTPETVTLIARAAPGPSRGSNLPPGTDR